MYCNWMNRNKKPSNKGKIYSFINVWLLSVLPPTALLLKLMKLATPGKIINVAIPNAQNISISRLN